MSSSSRHSDHRSDQERQQAAAAHSNEPINGQSIRQSSEPGMERTSEPASDSASGQGRANPNAASGFGWSDAPAISSDRDHREIVHDLRMRVLAGEDVSAHEMLLIVEDIRRGRRSAGAPARAKGAGKGRASGKTGAKGKSAPSAPPADLSGILDQEI